MIPAWVGPYIGMPYKDKGRGPDGWDCWGGVRMVLAEVFGQVLPDYADAYTHAEDMASVSRAVSVGLAEGWQEVSSPAPGDLLIISIAGRPWHCGIMVTTDRFLHWPPKSRRGSEQLSSVERLDGVSWASRKKTFHRRVVAVANCSSAQ